MSSLYDFIFGTGQNVTTDIPGGYSTRWQQKTPSLLDRVVSTIQNKLGINYGGEGYKPSPSPQAQYRTAPSPQPQQEYGGAGFRIQVPGDNGQVELPASLAQNLGNELDKYGLATEAARVLIHPREQTYTPQEVAQYGHENWNGGENPQFVTDNTDRLQNNGTIDRGVMRENSATFRLLQGSHKWNTILKENGLKSFDDLHDTAKSIRYAKILGDYYEQDLNLPRWLAWFAAPLDLRTRKNGLASEK